jgi:plastocyanin
MEWKLIPTGETIRFTPAKAGVYPVYCGLGFSIEKHRAKGMEGVLEVTEQAKFEARLR